MKRIQTQPLRRAAILLTLLFTLHFSLFTTVIAQPRYDFSKLKSWPSATAAR